ncbi:TlpA family protein disulfide reductase [Dyella sp. M7H15-1]|uniref:TlpA disulfide reductase family protein n=1 Tax=Dyella sp. M7H15-1 TaxID=2501295 RepID=UPI001004F769|nr:TlpA disulfide reductase family protein [Dyella sp. M7H15-1]QAU24175.1 TlpA family protein disulfide reductase [Dyella sp. M7H15-1]
MLSRTHLLILSLALLAAIAGGWLQRQNHPTRAPTGVHVANVGDLRPDLALLDLHGKEHRLSEFQGKRVLINFWASWCAPCLAEMPELDAAQHKFRDQGAIVLGIAMDAPTRVQAFLASHPVDYPILIGQLDTPSTSLRFGDTDEVLPFSVLLDEQGHVLATHRGPLDHALLARWLSPAVAL